MRTRAKQRALGTLLVLSVLLGGCADAPPCLSAQQHGTIEQMAQVNAPVRTGTALGMPAITSAFQHTLVKVRLPDKRAVLCHITNDQAQVFRVGEVVRGPWGASD